MCGRFVLMSPGRDLAERFGLEEEPSLTPRYNIAPTQFVAVIRQDRESAKRSSAMVKWGLIPFWAKDPAIGNKMINARAETAAAKPAFKAAFKHRRCLVPSDGFYEWKKSGGKKQPYLFTTTDEAIFAFAGLWEQWKDPEGGIVESCTILTTDANELLQPIHDRMPVILPPEGWENWLDPTVSGPEALQVWLKPYPADRMEGRAVSAKVNRSTYDAPDCVEEDPRLLF